MYLLGQLLLQKSFPRLHNCRSPPFNNNSENKYSNQRARARELCVKYKRKNEQNRRRRIS
jgi:hypothetical protein